MGTIWDTEIEADKNGNLIGMSQLCRRHENPNEVICPKPISFVADASDILPQLLNLLHHRKVDDDYLIVVTSILMARNALDFG